MTQRTIDCYELGELSDEARATALEEMRDINVAYAWWDWIYAGATDAGIRLAGFDLHTGAVDLRLTRDYTAVALAITRRYLRSSTIHTRARAFLHDAFALRRRWQERRPGAHRSDVVNDPRYHNLGETLRVQLAFAYRDYLREEYNYRLSDEAVAESIEANAYLFTIDGKRQVWL